jgi:hypothetical protein
MSGWRFSLIFLCSALISFSQQKARIGMTLEEVAKLFPNAEETRHERTITITYPDTLHGLADRWGFNFEGGKLRSMMFHKYISELNETNFNKCLKATKAIIADYTEWYGEPDSVTTGKTKFVDPYKKKHWGYDVLEARWSNVSGEKMKVEFTFLGGKGEYQFLVVVTHFPKDYPYYE